MKRNLLKEVISDAKMVKEVAIANARKALEESINPTLKSMLVAKLEEMELDDDMIDEVEDDEIDLNAALSELNEEEDEEVEDEEVEIDDEIEDKDEEDEDGDEVINIEDMTDEDLSKFIKDEIEDMIETGELEPGSNFDMGGEDEDVDVEIEIDDLEVGEEDELEGELDEILKEIESEEELREVEDEINAVVETLYLQAKRGSKIQENRKVRKYKRALNEARKTISHLKTELNEINLLNSKLLYTNKIFKGHKNLRESQMLKILGAFDKAKSTKEAKLVYETLKENLKPTTTMKSRNRKLQEGIKSQASNTLTGVKGNQHNMLAEELVQRFQHLAGIK